MPRKEEAHLSQYEKDEQHAMLKDLTKTHFQEVSSSRRSRSSSGSGSGRWMLQDITETHFQEVSSSSSSGSGSGSVCGRVTEGRSVHENHLIGRARLYAQRL